VGASCALGLVVVADPDRLPVVAVLAPDGADVPGVGEPSAAVVDVVESPTNVVVESDVPAPLGCGPAAPLSLSLPPQAAATRDIVTNAATPIRRRADVL
jgi:hypothetical protein